MKDEIRNNLLMTLDSYYANYICLHDTLRVYEILDKKGSFVSDENLKQVISGAMADCFTMNMARLLDKSSQSMTIFSWLDKLRKNAEHFDDSQMIINELNKLEIRLGKQDVQDVINVIRERRDKQLAHNDKKYFMYSQSKVGGYIPFYKFALVADVIKNTLRVSYKLLDTEPKFSPLLGELKGVDVVDAFNPSENCSFAE